MDTTIFAGLATFALFMLMQLSQRQTKRKNELVPARIPTDRRR